LSCLHVWLQLVVVVVGIVGGCLFVLWF
jgi:hypothetical protein